MVTNTPLSTRQRMLPPGVRSQSVSKLQPPGRPISFTEDVQAQLHANSRLQQGERSQSISRIHPPGRRKSFTEDVQAQLRAQGRPVEAIRLTPASLTGHIPAASGSGISSNQVGVDPRGHSNGVSYKKHENPEEVAQAIFDLRERREQQTRSRQQQQQQERSQSTTSRRHREREVIQQKSPQPTNNMPAAADPIRSPRSSGIPKSLPTSPQRAQLQRQNDAKLVQASVQAKSLRSEQQDKLSMELQNTEVKIDGLMQELDDLKFFEELDQAQPAPLPARSQSVPRPRPQSPSRHYPFPTKSLHDAPIPTGMMIRAASPGRLPPPPPAVLQSPALDDGAPLPSPRQISKFDRVALELETQTLCRKVDVLRREKETLLAQIDMYEVARQDQDHNTEKVLQLEAALREVRTALKQAKAELHAVREQTVTEYEIRLHDNVTKLQATQSEVDKLRKARDAAHEQLLTFKTEMNDLKNKIHGEHKARETELEMQLQEVADLADELQKEVQEKEQELLDMEEKNKNDVAAKDAELIKLSRDLRKQLASRDGHVQKLTDAVAAKDKALVDRSNARDDAYEEKLAALQEQVELERSKFEKEKIENRDLQNRILEQTKQINQYKKATKDQSTLITDITERLDSVHSEYRQKYSDLKDTYESKDRRRSEEFERIRQSETSECEERIQALQERMRLITERHLSEMQQYEADWEAKLINQRIDIESEYKQQLTSMSEELATTKQQYECSELERQRSNEIADAVPTMLDTRTKELEAYHVGHLQQCKEQHELETMALQAQIDDLNAQLQARIDALKQELDQTQHAKQTAIQETQNRMEELQSSYEQTKNALSKEKIRNEMLAQLQVVYEQTKSDLRDEKKRNERSESEMRVQIAVLEGNIRVNNSSMAQRIEMIAELEATLRRNTREYESSQIESQQQIKSLDDKLKQANHVIAEQRAKADRAEELEVSIAELQQSFEQRLAEIQTKYVAAQNDLSAARMRHEMEETRMLDEISLLEVKIRNSSRVQQSRDERDQSMEVEAKELESLRSELRFAKSALESARLEITMAGERLAELQINHDKVLEEKTLSIEKLNVSMKRLLQTERTLNVRLTALEREIGNSNSDLQQERIMNEELRTELDRAKISLDDLAEVEKDLVDSRDESNSLRGEVDCLQVMLREANESLELEKTQLDVQKAELATFKKLTDEQSGRISYLEEILSIASNRKAVNEKRNEELLRDIQEANDLRSAELKKNETIVNNLRSDLLAVKEKLRSAEALLKQKCSEIADRDERLLKPRSSENSSHGRRLLAEVDRLRNELNTCYDDLEKERSDLFTKSQQLETTEINAERRENELQDQISRLQDALNKVKCQHTSDLDELQRLEWELNQPKQTGNSLEMNDDKSEKHQREQISMLEERVRLSESAIEEKNSIISNLESRLEAATNDSSSSENKPRGEIIKLHSKLANASDRREEEENSISLLPNVHENERKKNQEEKLAEKANLIADLESRLAKSLSMERETNARLRELQEEITQKRDEIETLRKTQSTASSEMRERIAKLEGKLLASESVLSVKQCSIDELEQRLHNAINDSSSTTKDLQREIEDLLQRLCTTTEQLTKEKCESEAMDKFLKKLRAQHREETDERQGKILMLESKLLEVSSKERTLQSTEATLRQDWTLLERKLRLTESNLFESREEIVKLESQLLKAAEESTCTIKILEDDVANLNVRISRKNIELRDNEESLALRIEELDEKSKLISVLESELLAVRDSGETSEVTLKVQIAMLEGKVRANDAAMKEKRNALEKLQNDLNRSGEDSAFTKKALQQEITELANELTITQDLLSSEKANLKCKANELDEVCKSLKKELRDKSDLIDTLESRLSKAVSDDKAAKIRLSELEVDKIRVESEVEGLRDSLKSTSNQLEKERQELDECLDQLDHLQKHLKKTKKKADEVLQLEQKTSSLDAQLRKVEREKFELNSQIEKLKCSYDEVLSRLVEFEQKADLSSKSRAELEMSVGDLQNLLLQERREREGLNEKLSCIQSDLDAKNHQVERIPNLVNQLKEMMEGREELQAQLGRVEAELEKKEKQIAQATEQYASVTKELEGAIAETSKTNERLMAQLRDVEAELTRKTDRLTRQVQGLESDLGNQISANDELKFKLRKAESDITSQKIRLAAKADEFSSDAQTKLETLTRAKATLESKIREFEEDREDREKRMKESSEKFSNKILELQMKVEELTIAKDTIQSRLSRAESELEEKEAKLISSTKRYTTEVAELKQQLVEYASQKDDLKQKLAATEAQLSAQVEASAKLIESRTMELRGKAEAEAKEKRSLQAIICDIEGEVQRKEKQIKDIVDRYTKEISTLENKLDDESRAKTSLHRRLSSFQSNDLVSLSDIGSESSDLLDRINSLERTIDIERAKAREADRVKRELVLQLEENYKANALLKEELDQLKVNSSRMPESATETTKLIERMSTLQKSAEQERQWVREADLAKRQAEEKLSAQQETIAALKNEIEYLRDKSLEVVSESSAWESLAKIDSLERSVEVERALSRESDLARRELERKLSELKRAKEDLEEEVNSLKAASMMASPKASIQSERLSPLERSVHRAKLLDTDRKNVELEKSLTEKDNTISSLEEQVKQFRLQTRNGMYTESSDLKAKISELEQAVEAERSLSLENQKIRLRLEANLADESSDKARLLAELDGLRKESLKSSNAVSESRALRKQLTILEQSIGDDHAGLNGSDRSVELFQRKLAEAELNKKELEKRLEKANAERAEVINALEEVINEVQSREEEIEALASILRKRDEELEHAKLIATKAVASAQEIKNRYKGKGQEREAELTEKIDELQSSMKFLTHKNENLQIKATRLEKELEEQKQECGNLQEEIRKRKEIAPAGDKDEGLEGQTRFMSLKDDFNAFEYPTQSTGTMSIDFNETMSTQSEELNSPTAWLNQFDSNDVDDHSSYAAQSEPSRRSVERDALRKYVRKRYLKSKATSN